MLSILGRSARRADGITRREALRVGGLGFTGLMWSDWLRSRANAGQTGAGRGPAAGTFGKAKACILIFNYGGPSHLDVWDLNDPAFGGDLTIPLHPKIAQGEVTILDRALRSIKP